MLRPFLRGVLPTPVDYAEFVTYVRYGLQYHYRYRLDMRIDLDLEFGVRARIAVMLALHLATAGLAWIPGGA